MVAPGTKSAISPNRMAKTPRSATAHQFWARRAHMASLRAASVEALAHAPTDPVDPAATVFVPGAGTRGGLAWPTSLAGFGSLGFIGELLFHLKPMQWYMDRVHRATHPHT